MQLTFEHLEFLSPFFKGKDGIAGEARREQFQTTETLLERHFSEHSNLGHICRPSLSLALQRLKCKPATIVETGSAAWGTKSSLLFDSYVNSFGGIFFSVDLRVEPIWTLSRQCSQNSQFFCDDSVTFLRKSIWGQKIDLCYLDSWDLDVSDPMPAAIHGLNEFFCVLPALRKYGGLLLIDDTPRHHSYFGESCYSSWQDSVARFGIPPGKGSLVFDFLERHKYATLLYHEYQVLYEFAPVFNER